MTPPDQNSACTCKLGWCSLITLALLVGCHKPAGAPPAAQPSPERIPAVTVVRPERKTLHRIIEQPAQVEAFEETPLVARISGYVQKVHADIGDRVTGPRYDAKGKQVQPGQVLAELWVPEMEEEHRQKRALVAQAEAEVEQAAAAVEAAEANVATAKAGIREAEAARARAQANYERWASEYQRVEALVQRGVIDAQTRDETRNQFKAADASRQEVEAKVHSAQASAKESEAKRDKAKADLAAAKARVQVAHAEEGRLAALLQYSKVCAPFDGVVTRRHVHTGHFLQPASGDGMKPLFIVARMDTVRILVDVPEADAMYIREGAPARIRFQMLRDEEIQGAVTRTSWSLDPKARNLRTEVDLPNPKGILRPGMYAYATFRAEFPDRLTVPASAISTSGIQPVCFIVEDGKAIRTPVQLGLRNGNVVEVIKKQVKGSGDSPRWESFSGREEVVLGSAGSLADGQAVTLADRS